MTASELPSRDLTDPEIRMRSLYSLAWKELCELRSVARIRSDIEPCATPVLAFGRWRTALVSTAALNPSEREFRDKAGKPLEGSKQRFIHWECDDLSSTRIEEAFRRAEGYFELGNFYPEWFGRYEGFLNALGCPFESGMACHTDYVSPIATSNGLSDCATDTKSRLPVSGERFWMGVLEQLRQVELIFGQGRGWHRIEELFGTTWRNLETPFDKKGSNSGHVHEHLLFADTSLPESRRRILVYWWKPNRDGSPLCFLSQAEGRLLGRQIREHASGIAPGLQLLRPA